MDVRTIEFQDTQNLNHVMYLLDVYSKIAFPERQHGFSNTRENLIQGLKKQENLLAYGACMDNKPAGVVLGFLNFNIFRAMPFINIHFLYVQKEYQRQGVAAALMRAIEDRAKELGCCKLTLEVRETNHIAKHIYSRIGYQNAKFGANESALEFWEKNIA